MIGVINFIDFHDDSIHLHMNYIMNRLITDPSTPFTDLVGVNKDSYLILENLPQEYDSRVKAMEVDERPTEQYNDIGGLDKQIQELIEAVVLPMTHKDKFENLGIQPPKVRRASDSFIRFIRFNTLD